MMLMTLSVTLIIVVKVKVSEIASLLLSIKRSKCCVIIPKWERCYAVLWERQLASVPLLISKNTLFFIFYRVENDTLLIVRVLHGSRDYANLF